MDATLLTFIIISVPGLLSATCSSPAYNAPTPNSGYAKSSTDNRFDVRQNEGNGMGLGMPWAEDYAPSSQRSPLSSSLLEQQQHQQREAQRCENGWCAEDGSCSCNPCWSGPTCKEYVDRFSPRFLAEEPFFIVDSSSAITILPFPSAPSVDSTEGVFPFVNAVQTSSSFSSPLSSLQATASRTNKEENSSSAKPNLLDSNLSNEESKLSSSSSSSSVQFAEYTDNSGGGSNAVRSSPLFRIEAADDDLGLTCQLGQVGPAATCPCATPRYKVIGASTTIPDDRSLASSSSTNHPEETDNNRPLQESSFYNSLPETNLSKSPQSSSSSSSASTSSSNVPTKQYRATDGSSASAGDNSPAHCPSGWATTQCQKLNSIMFFADEETGDVFLQNGYNLQSGRYYFITLQVYALPVNSSGYKPWREEIVATLYVKSSSSQLPTQTEQLFTGLSLEQTQGDSDMAVGTSLLRSSSETQEVGTVDEVYEDDFTKEETSSKDELQRHEGSSRETEIARRRMGKKNEEANTATTTTNTQSQSNAHVFNYHPLEDLNDRKKIDSIKNNSDGNAGVQQQEQHPENMHTQQTEEHNQNDMSWESSEQFGDDDDENDSGAENEGRKMTDKGTVSAVSSSSSSSSSHSYPFYGKIPVNKQSEFGRHTKLNNGAHNVMIMPNVKNKLPYALREDKPHFKYPLNYPALDFVGAGDSAFETLIPEDEYPAGRRKKREVPDKSPFTMSISRINSDGANTTALALGVLTRLKLKIQVSSAPMPKDFTLEIRTLRATETNIRFVILSAYVISIGSDISFDKGSTNLAPLMMPWNNSTVYESVVWNWKDVKCEEREQQPSSILPTSSVSLSSQQESSSPPPSPSSQPTGSTEHPQQKQQSSSNNVISIEFEVVAVNPKEGGSVVNRWMSSGSSAAIASTSAIPTSRKLRERMNPKSDKNLDDDHSAADFGMASGGGDVDLFSMLPPHRGELNDNDIDDGTLKASRFSPSISSNPFRKSTKQFHVTLVPVSAYISFPNGQDQPQLEHPNNNNNNGNIHSGQSFSLGEDSVEKVMKIKKGLDKGDDGRARTSNQGNDDTVTHNGDGNSSSSTNNNKSDRDDYYLYNKSKDGTAQGTTTTVIKTHIMLPVKYSPGDNNGDISRTTHQPFENAETSRKSVLKNVKYKGFKDVKNNAAGVDILLEGPTEIPQGGWVSYMMKVYLNHSCQFQLRLEPVQGNEIQYQDTVSVGDIRIVDIGKHFSSCSKIPKKGGFRVTCRKLNGRKGDYCTVESPVMRYCSTPSTKETAKDLNAGGGDDTSSIGSTEVSSNQTRNDSEEQWNKLVRKEQKRRSEHITEEPGNMLQFKGIIYGFPGSAPGSQFVLRAHVHVESIDESNMDGSRFPGTSSSTDVQVKSGGSSFSVDMEKTLSGKIVHRKQKVRGPLSVDPSSLDFPDGKIPVMREFPAYHYRKRRNVFLEHMSHISKKIALSKNGTGSSNSSSSRMNTSSSTNDDNNNNNNNSDENANNRVPSKNSTVLLLHYFSSKSDNQTKPDEMRVDSGIGTSAKKKASPLVTRNTRRRRSAITTMAAGAPVAIASDPQSAAGANMGHLSSHPNLHRFRTWENFVKITSSQAAVRNNRKRRSKRTSPWSNLL